MKITATLTIDDAELHFTAVHASGPGGQHVNKAATTVQLRFDVAHSPSLPDDVRARLMELAGQLLTQEGVLVIDARQYRSQARNREDARERLLVLIRAAARPPKSRQRTKIPHAARSQRRQDKQRRSTVKRLRRPPGGEA